MSESINGWQYVLAFLPVVLGISTVLIKMNTGLFLLSQKRTKLLLKLLKSNHWRTAHPATLQIACKQMLGKTLDDRDIVLILKRHDPLTLLLRRLRAGKFICRTEDGQSLRDVRSDPIFSYKLLENIVIFLSAIFAILLAIFCLIAWSSSVFAGAIAAVEAVWGIWILFILVAQLQAAHLLTEFERHHPPVDFSQTGKEASSKKKVL